MGEKPTEVKPAYGLEDEPPDGGSTVIRAEIEHTRAEMSETIGAIQDRLSPQRLMNDAKETVRDATVGKVKTMVSTATERAGDIAGQVQDGAQHAADYVRNNPMPAILIGAGVGWLLLRSRAQRSMPPTPRYGRANGQDTLGDKAQRVQDRVQQYGHRAETEVERWLRENPLTVGVATLALGAAVGLSMPRTQAEDAWMGETRDTLVEQAQEAAQSTAQTTVDTVERVVEEVQKTAG